MTYIEGFVTPVAAANQDAYRRHAADAAPIFLELGVRRYVEAWDDDLPEGKHTDFRKAVNAKPDEKVAFGWFEYPDRAARDATSARFRSDPRMKAMMANVPFDARRMIFGGFIPFVEEGSSTGGYVDGFVLPVPNDRRDAYRALAASAAALFREHGAVRDIEAWQDDVPAGEVTDFFRAVKSKDGEAVVFSFIEWPDRAARDDGWKKVMADERMKPDGDMPFDGQRMFWGGFAPILDTARQRQPAHA